MQQLSLRKYAVLIGVSHTAVAKAVKAGYINKGWDPKAKKIIVEAANNEWGNEVRQRTAENKAATEPAPLSSGLSSIPISENLSFSEARRRKEIYNAELARLAAVKEQGQYVEKEKVYGQLFEYGKRIRASFLSVPDRVIDNILAAKTRVEAHGILTAAIYEALQKLTEPPKLTD